MKKVELRTAQFQLEAHGDEMRVSGVVNKPNEWSHLLGTRKKFRETICEGVFEKALKRAKKVDFLADHNTHFLLASTTNGSLRVEEIQGEVRMDAVICPTSYGKDYFALMQSGLCNEMSFGFIPRKDRWQKQADGTYKRWIEDMDIIEVTACRYGAYSQSEINARGLEVVEDPDIPNDDELIEAEIRAMDDETFEQFKSRLKSEVMNEVLEQLKSSQEETKEDETSIETVETVEEEKEVQSESNEEVTQEEVVTEAIEVETEVTQEVEEVVETEETPTVEEQVEEVTEESTQVEEVKPFDVSAYLEAIEKLKSQKSEV